jgi:DNA repair photolyase
MHWGGVSDPFQPIEGKYKRSLGLLKVFARTKYPFIFSTKGKIVATEEYLNLLRECNTVGQVSIMSPRYDKMEQGAPPYAERLKIVEALIPVCKRVNVRLQPYTVDVFDDVMKSLRTYADMGVYGVTIEGIKVWYKSEGLVRVAGDYVYPKAVLESHYRKIRAEAHKVGLKFFCGENRLRNMGDSLCCCGSAGLEGFTENKANLNHYFFDKMEFTEKMDEPGTGYVFKTLYQDSLSTKIVAKATFREMMERVTKTKKALEIYGFK